MFARLSAALIALYSASCLADVSMPLTIRPVDDNHVSQSTNIVHASGWVVIDDYDLPGFAVDFSRTRGVYKVALDCNVKSRACAVAVASVSFRGELDAESRALRIRSFKNGTLVMDADEAPTCQHQTWTVALAEKRMTIHASLDSSNWSEADACPNKLVFNAHLGTLPEALKNAQLDPRLHAAQGIQSGMDYADVEKSLGEPDSEACGGCERIERSYGDAVRVVVSKSTAKVLAVYVFDQPLWAGEE